jgi:hypothetical protein
VLLTLAIVAGINQPDKAIGSPNSTSSRLSLPTTVSEGAAGRIGVRKEAAWLGLAFSIALKLVFGQ